MSGNGPKRTSKPAVAMSALGHKQTWRRPTTVVRAAIDHDVLALNLLCSKPTNKSTMRAASISRPMADMMRSSKEINESGCSLQ